MVRDSGKLSKLDVLSGHSSFDTQRGGIGTPCTPGLSTSVNVFLCVATFTVRPRSRRDLIMRDMVETPT